MLRARPVFKLLARLLPEMYSTQSNYYYPAIIEITMSSRVIGLRKSYFPLIRLPRCYRTVCYWIVCYWTVRYWTVQLANHIQGCSLNQPITVEVVITRLLLCFCE